MGVSEFLMAHMDAISLIVLCATLVAAFMFKLNSGLLAIAVSLLMALGYSMLDPGFKAEKFLFNAFDSKLFLMLFGVMFLFSIAQENRTLELMAKKILAMCRGNARILPVILFLVAAVISAIGPGLISVTALVSVLIISLAKEMDQPAIRLVPFGMLGAFAGGLSPVTPTGLVAIELSAKQGIEGVAAPVALKMALTCVVYAVILYFFVFKWHKQKTAGIAGVAAGEAAKAPFTGKQIATLIGILAVAAVSAVFGINVGLVSVVVSVILLLMRAADEGAALKKVPWSTLLMITGVGILIGLVTELGGIDLLSNGLKKLSTGKTVTGIMAILSGVMSWVSSASGVVMPTLIPTVGELVEELEGANSVGLVNAISIGANMAALSPLSSCGGLMLAAYTTSGDVTPEDRNKMFLRLFILSACGVLLSGILGFVGAY